MGCGNSKQETVHNPVKPNNLKDINKTRNKNQNCAKEEYDYQLKDQHARKEVMMVGCESSKPEHAHAQEEVETQDKTSISLDRSQSNLQESDDYQKIDQHPKKVLNMGCGNSKQETVHDPVKPNNPKDTNKTPNKNQNCAKEENDYQLIDQHARKEVMMVGYESSKPQHANVQEEVETQDKTFISLDRSHSNLQETDNYQKIDQHPNKEVIMVGCESSKPEYAHVQEKVETQDKTSISLDRSHSNLQETDNYQKKDQHPNKEVIMVSYESSKPEHAHVQEEVETQDKTSISLDRSHSNLQETDNYQEIDQHPKKEVIMVGNESSKSEHAHVQEEVETQDKTSISLNRSHSNLQETDDYQKIDQHPKKEVIMVSYGSSKPEHAHVQEEVETQDKTSISLDRSHGNLQETDDYQTIDQHPNKEVIMIGNESSKSEHAHVQEEIETQDKTSISLDRSHSNLQETDDYQKIDQHPKKVKENSSGNSKPNNDHAQENVESQNEIEQDTSNRQNNKERNGYWKIDEHARKAPKGMRNSPDLVTYFSSFSKDTRMIVRGFFVWITENIRYDVDGYFGRSPKAPCDGESVLTCGKSVCEGYARAFELLCRDAGIPVKKISGFAKGFGYSPSESITFEQKTDHAWNAVQLKGKWHLLDCTWGSGHLDSKTNDYKKEIDDFYFLTDPKGFVSDHFPYMDNNIEESQKWQLLSKPVSLEEFSSNVKYSPQAFKLGVLAVSHKKAYFEMKDELQMTLHSTGHEDIYITSKLTLEDGQKVQKNATFCYQENGLLKILVHPQKPGMYTLDIFGKPTMDTTHESIPHLMEYKFNCKKVTNDNHEYPTAYKGSFVEKCLLHEPLTGRLPAKTKIQFRISSPYLQQIMIDHEHFEKNGTIFTGKITTGDKGHQVHIFGKKTDPESKWTALFCFCTI